MSIIIEKGSIICYDEAELVCPICTGTFDASKKIEKAKYPCFDTKCPLCKGKITILLPIFGGTTKCWETECPESIQRLETVAPFLVNGVEVKDKTINLDLNGDEDDGSY